jgi:hypothetical protein
VSEIKMFVWREDGVVQCATEEDVHNITTIDVTKEPYSNGRWHAVGLKDNVLRKDNIKAEQSLYVTDPDTGLTSYQQWRQRDAFAAQVIEAWDFTNPHDETKILPVTENGISNLPDKVAFYLVNLIWVRYKGDPKSFREVSG